MTIAAGTTLGHYEIRSQLGAGGMGEVYLAEDAQLRRRVALKISPSDIAANQDRMRRFVQEAQAAATLNHPNIAHIYEIGEYQGADFIAMEFIDGQTLRERLRGLMKLTEVLEVAMQTANALSAAHAQRESTLGQHTVRLQIRRTIKENRVGKMIGKQE